MIDWEMIGFKRVEKSWGSEDWLVNTDQYCAKILTIKQNCGGSFHYHELKTETFLCLEGAAVLLMHQSDGETILQTLLPGDMVRIQPLTAHLLIGRDPKSQILEVSTHHDDDDIARLWRVDGGADE